MDFNVFIEDFSTSIESLTKESKATGRFSSVYCRKVSKAVDQIASNNEYSNVVTGLWCVVINVAAHVKYLNPIRAFSQLCLKIFRQCAKVILNIQWQNLEEDSPLRQNFLASLEDLHGKLVPLSITQFHLLEGLVEDPWTHPTLAKIMGGEIDDCNKEEVHSYIENEDPIILQLRVDLMLKENCEEFALNLCNSYLSHPKLQSDLDIKKTQLSLLYKLGHEDKLQEECQKLNIQDAVRVIRLLQTSRTHRKMCTVLTQTFMVQNWIRPSNVEASKELLKLWIRHQLVVDKEQDQFKESVWAVAKLSQATEQIALLIDVLREECGDSFLQLFIDMCIFAINVDKGQMEANRNEGNREAAAARRSDMASICDKLSSLCHHISIKVARMCALTAFALKPTEQAFRKIGTFYGQGSNQCDQSLTGKNHSPGIVNPATLYEVERLLNMLRPGYLNPDQMFSKIQILCRTYLQECLKEAEKFQKLQCSSQSSSDNSCASAAQTDTSGVSAASTTSCMSTILAESFSTEDIHNIQQLLSRMRLLNIADSKTSLQDLDALTPTIPSLPGSTRCDHTYQITKNVAIKQQHQHNLFKEGDKIQQKDNRADEQLQTTNVNQPLKAELTHQHLQYTQQLHDIIQAALEQDSATLLKLAQSSSPEMIQTAINIIKSKLPNSSVPVNDQQHKPASSQINNTASLPGAHPTGSAQLQPSNNLQQIQPQLNLQLRQDRIREDPSRPQCSRPHPYNKLVVTSVSNNIPPLQLQAIRVQAPNPGSYISPPNLTLVDNGKQVIANSVVLHNVNQGTPSSSTSGNMSQEKLKAESLLLAKSCVGEIRHLLQSQMAGLQQKPIRDPPQISGSAAALTGASIASTSAGAEFSSSRRLQTAAELAKQATVRKIQESFSQNILYQIRQKISKQEQNGIALTGRPYTLSVIQPQPLDQPQPRDHSSNQQTISNLHVPSSISLSGLNEGNAKPSRPPISHGILQSLKPHRHGSVVPSVADATHKPQSSSLVVIKQPKIISLSNLPDFPVQSSVIAANKCPAFYVTTCPVSCISNISLSNLNNHHNSPFTQHNFSKPNTVSQSSLNNTQPNPLYQNILPNLNTVTVSSLSNQQPNPSVRHIWPKMVSQSSFNNTQSKPLYQNILPNLNTVTVSSLSNQQPNPSVRHIWPKMVSQSSLNNTQPKPSYQHILPNLNTIAVSSSSNQQPSPVVKHTLSNIVSQPSLNNSQSKLLAQNTLPKLQTMTISSLNHLQASPSVEHVATKPSTSTLSTLNNKLPQHVVQNICSETSEEIASGQQQLEIILTNAASEENITVLLQTDEFPKSNETADYSQDIMESKTVSDSNCSDVSNNALYRCILCSVAFKTLDDLRHHVKYVCKPEQQSSSVCNTKFKLNKASAKNAGIEATTVFQCLRCLELCISETGIKQHRLICRKVPLKPSHVKNGSTDNKGEKALTVTVGYNSSSIEENDNCNKSESEESSEEELNSKTGDSYGGPLVSAATLGNSCQLSLSGQLEDSIDKQSVASALGVEQPGDVGGESPGHHEPKRISQQETVNGMEINTLLKSESENSVSKQIAVTSAVNQCESKQPVSSGPGNMFSIQAVNGAQINNLVNTESRIISSQQTWNHVQANSSLNTAARIIPSQHVVTDAQTNTESCNGLHSIPEPTSHSASAVPIRSECVILPEQLPVTSNSSTTPAAITPGRDTDKCHLVQADLIQPVSISNSENLPPLSTDLTDYSKTPQISVVSIIANTAYQLPLTAAFLHSTSVIAKENTLFPLSKLCLSTNDVMTKKNVFGSDNLRDTSPRKPALRMTNVLPGAACADLAKSCGNKFAICEACSRIVCSTGSLRCEMCTIRNKTGVKGRALQEKVQNAEHLRDDVFNGYMRVVENVPGGDGDAPKVEHVDSLKSSLVPMMHICTDGVKKRNSPENDVFNGYMRVVENVPGGDGDAPKVEHVDSVKISVVPMMHICTDGVKKRNSPENDVFNGYMRVVENVPGGDGDAPKVEHVDSVKISVVPMMHICTDGVKKRNSPENDVFNGYMRVVENVPGGDGDAPKVEHVDSVKISVVPMMHICTDGVKKRNSPENVDSSMQISMLQSNAEHDGSSQRYIKEFKTGIMAIDSGAGNKNTSDMLVLMDESFTIKEVVINESKDGDLITKTLPETFDTRDRCNQVQNEEHSFMNCVQGNVKSVKTQVNENKSVSHNKGGSTNSRTDVNLGKDSLFCQICQVLFRCERMLLQHVVVKHLRPYTVKTSNSSLSYICHFCRSSFTTFKQYMQHMSHHSVIVSKKMSSFQSAQTSQRSERNACQEKLTKKHISKNITMTTNNRKMASRPAASRLKRQSLAIRTRAFLDRWRMAQGSPPSCVPAGEDYNCNQSAATGMEQRSAVLTAGSSKTTCLINNIAGHDELCCQVEKSALTSPEHVRAMHPGDQEVDDTCGRRSRNIPDSPGARRKAVRKNHSWISKRRRMSEVTEIRERDQEHGTLEKRTHSGQPEGYIHPDHSDNRNSKSADLQDAQRDNVDLFDNTGEPKNNSSVILNQKHIKDLQPNGAQLKSDETLLCSKDLEADSSCNSDSAITADHLQLPVVKDANPRVTKFHADVTVKPSSFSAPKTVKPSYFDSYLAYINKYPGSENKSVRKTEK